MTPFSRTKASLTFQKFPEDPPPSDKLRLCISNGFLCLFTETFVPLPFQLSFPKRLPSSRRSLDFPQVRLGGHMLAAAGNEPATA